MQCELFYIDILTQSVLIVYQEASHHSILFIYLFIYLFPYTLPKKSRNFGDDEIIGSNLILPIKSRQYSISFE